MKQWIGVAALAAMLGLASVARADGVRVEVPRVLGKGPARVAYDNPRLFDDLARTWADQRGTLDKEIERQLGHLNARMPKGVNFTRQKSRLAPATITTRVDRGTGLAPVPIMEVVFEARGNALTTRFTQPTILGSYADPEFKVTYDLRAVVYVPVNDKARALRVSGATFEVRNVRITPENAPAQVVDFAADVYRVLGGKDYKALAERTLSPKVDLKDRVNNLLRPVNQALGKVTGPDKKLTVTQKDGFLLRVTNAPASSSGPPPVLR
jgi:hypothetical protein